MADRAPFPPGSGIILWGAAGCLIALASLAAALATGRPLIGLLAYVLLWILALLAASLTLGDDNG